MAEYTPERVAELVAEARKLLFSDSMFGYEDTREGDLIFRLADALESTTTERDELRAVIEEVREFASGQATEIRRQYGRTGPAGYLGFANACEDILDILSRTTGKEGNDDEPH